MQSSGRIRIGISGWRYPGWRGVFYPPGLQQRRELEFASQPVSLRRDQRHLLLPAAPRLLPRTGSPRPPTTSSSPSKAAASSRTCASSSTSRPPSPTSSPRASSHSALKLGPILWQFPPQMRFDTIRPRFAAFFKLLPRTTRAASQARRTLRRTLCSIRHAPASRPPTTCLIRHAVEIRHESFATPAFSDLLRRHDIGLVVADTVEWPLLLDVTSSLVYLRLHGSEQLYASGYEPRPSTSGPAAFSPSPQGTPEGPTSSTARRRKPRTSSSTSTTTSRSGPLRRQALQTRIAAQPDARIPLIGPTFASKGDRAKVRRAPSHAARP